MFRRGSLISNLEGSADKGDEIKIDIDIESNNKVQRIAPITIDINIEDYEVPCIHKVPKNLRKVNEEAYTPQLISIGPYHHGKEQFADMEMHKRKYKHEFYERINEDRQRRHKRFIKSKENQIRRHYAELSKLSSDEFVEMILLDAIFIIELFFRVWNDDRSDFLLNEVWLGAIRRDLQLLENQLPYFVLEGLYYSAITVATKDELFFPSFTTLSCIFFQLHIPHNRPPYMQPTVKIKHFTGLCRYALVAPPPRKMKLRGITPLDGLPNAVKLKKSGVKFMRHKGTYLVDIILEKRIRPMSFSKFVELKIPRITITDNTECLIRNLMALELCHYPSKTYICDYIHLMDSLINTENDVDLLAEEGIIHNPSGDNSVTANMFNKLRLQIPPSQSSFYSTIYKDMRYHYNNRWNHAMETLNSMYFSNPWRGTATVVAIILLVLSLTQTVFSILQVFFVKQR